MDLFFAIFKKDFKKDNFFEQGKVLDLGKVCCVFLLLKNMQSQFKTIYIITIKHTREEGTKYS